MLLTDGCPNTPEDLRVYESSILDVSHVETINLDAKLKLATEEISEIVLNILLDHSNVATGGDVMRRALGVSDVVVTRQMKRWHALYTLAIFYRDAYNDQLNDRYLAKWNEYLLLARGAKDITTQYGIGLVNTPVPQAGTAVVGAVPGLLPATVYYVQITWVSATGAEGNPSVSTAFEAPVASLVTVTNGVAGARGGDGVQRLYRADGLHGYAAEFDADRDRADVHGGELGAGGGNRGAEWAIAGLLHHGRVRAEERVTVWRRQRAL